MTSRTVTGGKRTAAYRTGREARQRGEPNSACPHPCGSKNTKRRSWFDGWYDEKYEGRFTGLRAPSQDTSPAIA